VLSTSPPRLMGLSPVDTVSNYAASQSVYGTSLLVFCSSPPHNSGREIMAQRMDTLAVRDPSALLRMRGDLLGRADGHRPLGIEARQQPGGWPVEVPGGASLGQQTG